jgi:hypothetical protein
MAVSILLLHASRMRQQFMVFSSSSLIGVPVSMSDFIMAVTMI